MAKKTKVSKKSESVNHQNSTEENSNGSNQLIQEMFVLNKFKPLPKHQEFLDCVMNPDTNIAFVEGVAGSSKTYLSVYAALKLLKEGKVDKILYVRSLIESASQKMGFLPGDSEEKTKPWAIPLMEKCDELIKKSMTDKLVKAEIIKCIPVNHLRGSTFQNCFVLIDELQNFTDKEIQTVLTRIGKNCKMVAIGDSLQSDIHNSAFLQYFNGFDNEVSKSHGIHTFKFTEEEVTRSKILKYIVQVMKEIHTPKYEQGTKLKIEKH